MSSSLSTYLNDHLGGAQVAIELLQAMRDQHDDQEYREFAASLLPDIREDDQTLRSIVEKIDSSSSAVKEAGGWILEKLARLKLGHTGSTDFEMFESLEMLALGIYGKLCLWKALDAVSTANAGLHGYDFEELISRAQDQYAKVENKRLHLAQMVLTA